MCHIRQVADLGETPIMADSQEGLAILGISSTITVRVTSLNECLYFHTVLTVSPSS